jgi:hypothetical protein
VWRRFEPIGYGAGLVSFSSVAAPLLTGFSLTTIVELLGRSARGPYGDAAITAFAVAAGLLIFAIQAGLAASQLAPPVDQRAAQVPEAREHQEWMRRVREDQWRDANLAARLFRRTRYTYNLGILAFLVGLLCTLLPGSGAWSPARIVAVAAVGLATAVELVIITGSPRRLSHLLIPTLDTLPSDGQASAPKNREPEPIDLATVQRMVYGASAPGATVPPDAPPRKDPATTALAGLAAQLASLTGQLARLEVAVRPGADPGARAGQRDAARAAGGDGQNRAAPPAGGDGQDRAAPPAGGDGQDRAAPPAGGDGHRW